MPIVGSLPNTIANGQTADAVPLMADLNYIVSQVNANAASLSNTALLNSTNSFTMVQSGVAATNAANFPIASQAQNSVFNTFQSTLGTNTLTARIAALALSAWTTDAVFTFFPSQTNTGPVGITVDSAGSSSIFSGGQALVGGELRANVPAMVKRTSSRLELLGMVYTRGTNQQVLGFLSSETSGTRGFTFGSGLGVQGNTVFAAPQGYLSGLNMSTPNTTVMAFGTGVATDSSRSVLMSSSGSMTKTTGAWAVGSGNGGLDTGVIAAGTWYHFYEIMRPDTGVVDVVFSLSATAPTMPAGYIFSRLIGSWPTDGSSNWATILQNGDRFEWVTPALAFTHTNQGANAVTHSLSSGVPTNRPNVIALITTNLTLGVSGTMILITPLDTADSAPSATAAPLNTIQLVANTGGTAQVEVRVDANASIRTRADGTDVNFVNRVVTRGWIDRRGRDS
jgi:hypothetical protein